MKGAEGVGDLVLGVCVGLGVGWSVGGVGDLVVGDLLGGVGDKVVGVVGRAVG